MKFTFFERTPAAYLFFWLAIGIVLANSLTYSWKINIFLVLAGLIGYLYPSRNSFHTFHTRQGIGIALLLMVIGNSLPQLYDQNHTFEHSNKSGIFQVEISDYPREKAHSYQVEIKALRYSADSIHYLSTKGNAIIYLSKTKAAQHLKIGEHILIAGQLEQPRKIGNPDEFDYADYLHHKGINATAYIDSLHWAKDASLSNTFSLKRVASSLREQLLNIYKAHHINGEEFAVLSALTLGYTDEIDLDTRNAYSDAGAMHILAVSGLHVGIVYLILYYLLFWLGGGKRKRIFRSFVLIAALWFYAILTGLSPSVCRAAFMFTVFAIGKMFNFNTSTLNTVFFTAFVLLLVNPHYLYNISYLLSYSAVISIVTLMPYLQNIIHSKKQTYQQHLVTCEHVLLRASRHLAALHLLLLQDKQLLSAQQLHRHSACLRHHLSCRCIVLRVLHSAVGQCRCLAVTRSAEDSKHRNPFHIQPPLLHLPHMDRPRPNDFALSTRSFSRPLFNTTE
jgi:competence protein ComEC